MYYSAVSIIAALILIIVNQDILFRHDEALKLPALNSYKKFLISVVVYCVTDILWGVLRDVGKPVLFFIDTSVNYIAMAVAVWFWIGYIVNYYGKNKVLKTVFINAGRLFAAGITVLVIINIFKPILFTVDKTGIYSTPAGKTVISVSQALVLVFLLLHSLSLVFIRSTRKRQKYGILALFALITAAFITTQYLVYDLPYYSLAFLLGSCLLHIFVIEDEKERFRHETREAAKREIISASATYENIIRMLSKDYFDLFYVDLNTDEYIEYGSRTDIVSRFTENRGSDFFKTINKNVNKIVFEEDREKLKEALTKENVVRELEENGVFGIYYRLMIEDEPTYVSLKATFVIDDVSHIIFGITNVDAQMKDQIYAESLKEERKAYVRMNAFSRNLIVYYVVDSETEAYTEFSASEDFAKLGIAKKGSNFFEDTQKNSIKAIYSEDRPMFDRVFTKKNIIDTIRIDGVFIMEYRLLIGGKPAYVRLKAAEIEEEGKKLLIFGIENVDLYIRREQQQANELSAARELATKDTLTNVRNRNAFSQAKKQLNEQIEKYEAKEFAIVICDINGLKEVNDNLGHQAGDELIKSACSRICNIFKHSSVFRIGGDEFAVICQGQDYDNLNELLGRMNMANNKDDVQIAFGMTRYCIGQSVEDVMDSADSLMYEHKAALKGSSAKKAQGKEQTEIYKFPENLRQAYESSPLSFVYYQNINDRACPVLASDGFCKNTGMPRESVMKWLSAGMFERMHPDDVGIMVKISDDFLHHRGPYDAVFRCRLPRIDAETKGKAKEEYMYIHALGKWQTMPDGCELAVITYGNISLAQKTTDETLEMYTKLRHDSFYTDALTNIPNIHYLLEFGNEKLQVITDEGKIPQLVYIDIYSMQSYNNQYGFKEGDKLLCLTAKQLIKQFPKALVVRESDDHFIMLCDIDNTEKLEKHIYRTNRSIRSRAHGNTSGIRCGVCTVDANITLNEAIGHAKMALKRIENDMNREVEFFSNASNILYLQDRYIIENLDRAIKEGWIKIFYHAIYRVETEKVSAFECLARWDDPKRGIISPGVFITVLLKYHLLYKLDLCMFEQACREVKYRYDNSLPLVPVSVNFSRQDFDYVDVVGEMNRIYDKYNMSEYIDKSYFVVEITEQDIEAGKESFKEQLVKIKENGFRLWLDDFGSGYSAISSFSQYDFDLIKFDLELVKHLNDRHGVNQILLDDMVNLARKLGIHTLIEGVETREHMDFIRKIGCELAQGFYFNEPEPLDVILKRVETTGFIRMCETPEERKAFDEKWFE